MSGVLSVLSTSVAAALILLFRNQARPAAAVCRVRLHSFMQITSLEAAELVSQKNKSYPSKLELDVEQLTGPHSLISDQ